MYDGFGFADPGLFEEFNLTDFGWGVLDERTVLVCVSDFGASSWGQLDQ